MRNPVQLARERHSRRSAFMAARTGQAAALGRLLDRDPRLFGATDESGSTLLHDAAEFGQIQVLELLIGRGYRLDCRNGEGQTPLLVALLADERTAADNLILRGADINAADDGGLTALHVAANRGDGLLVQRLINSGASVHARDASGALAMHEAIKSGRPDAVDVLIRAGGDINARDDLGQTPLDWALAEHDYELADWMRAHGAISHEASPTSC